MRPTLGQRMAGAVLVVAASVWVVLPGTSAAAAPDPAVTTSVVPDPFGLRTPVFVVLDTSSSMDESATAEDGASGSRLIQAKAALIGMIDKLGQEQEYGLLSYPGVGAREVSGCAIGDTVTPLGPLDLVGAPAAVRRLRSSSRGTPTGPALTHASQILRGAGVSRATIVLVSDGESNCGEDPCLVARELRDQGLDVVVNTVSFQVGDAGQQELSCIADATGGRYVRADDGTALLEAVRAAATPDLLVRVDAPEAVPIVTGRLAGDDGTAVTVSVTNRGTVPAADVRVRVRVTDGPDGAVAVVPVTRPLRFLGNLGPGADTEAVFRVVPTGQAVTNPVLQVDVTAGNAATVSVSRQFTIGSGLDRTDVGPLLAGVERVVVMGDSYSSGEGAGDYQPGSTGEGNPLCHRSTDTYAARIWPDATTILACSGAVTADVFTPQRFEATGGSAPAQLAALREATAGDEPPQAVLLTIGGNDAGFEELADLCTKKLSCPTTTLYTEVSGGWSPRVGVSQPATYFTSRAADIDDDVYDVLTAIDAVVNAPDARDARDGDVAPIIVVPYVKPFPDVGSLSGGTSSCLLGTSAVEFRLFDAFLTAVNTEIAAVAYTKRAEGRPVYYAWGVADAFQPDHTICDGTDSFATSLTTTDVRTDTVGSALTLVRRERKQELLHPNSDGYAAVARAIVGWSNGYTAEPIEPLGDLAGPATSRPVAESWRPPWPLNRLPVSLPRVRIVNPLEDYLPGARVVIRLDSSPTVIGTAVADDEGRVRVDVALPPALEPGRHHVHVFGLDTDGEPRVTSRPLYHFGWWQVADIGLIALGLVGCIASIARMRHSWRRTRAAGWAG